MVQESIRGLRKVYSTATIIVLIIMCAGTAICLGIPDKLIGLFTTNANTISAGAKALRIISAGLSYRQYL